MNYAKTLELATARAAVAGALALGLFVGPAIASAAPANTVTPEQPTGTVTGLVTCGPTSATPGAPAQVGVAGLDLTTRSDNSGNFSLPVPASEPLTILVLSPSTDTTASRADVSVGAGQTLDIGPLDLAICPQPAPIAPDTSQQFTTGDLPSE